MKLILCRQNNIGSLFLRAVMWSPWCHSALWDDEKKVVYDSTLAQHGVKVTDELAWFSAYPEHEIRDLVIKDVEASRQWLKEQVGKPYDWTAILGMVFDRNWKEDNAWFCSEMTETYRSLWGVPVFRENARRITPYHQSIVV